MKHHRMPAHQLEENEQKRKNETKRVYYLTDERKKNDWKAKAKQNS